VRAAAAELDKNEVISIAIGPATQPGSSPPLYATWTATLNGLHGVPGNFSFRLRHPAAQGPNPTTWTFDQASPTPIRYALCEENGDQAFNSAGMSGSESLIRTSAWTAIGDFLRTPPGLVAETPVFSQIRTGTTFADKYNPCIATSQTGESVLVWANQQFSGNPLSPSDIFIAQFDANGNPVPAGAPVGILVHAADVEGLETFEHSPAVVFVGNDIVVVWRVPASPYCLTPIRIWARRYRWGGDGNPPVQPIAQSEVFAVDSDRYEAVERVTPARPTVALTTSTQPADRGKFFVAWNSTPSVTSNDVEIRGRYFDADGTPETGEFRVNQTTQPTEQNGTTAIRYLPLSGQHAAVYGPDKQVVVVHTAGNDEAHGVSLTYLPPAYADGLADACLAGDVTGDGLTTGPDGNDIQPFVTYLFDGIPTNLSIAEQARIRCAMDCDLNGIVDSCDVAPFVWLLLGFPSDGAYVNDCDHNCRPDYADIAGLMFPMTYCNPSPLECPCSDPPTDDRCCFCSLIPTPPGPVYVMPDCNENEIDDATDIANETSADCNTDGIPDECQLVYYDCNTNGVLDQCDVDPTDPDGDEWVSPDCNSNGWPDECDMAAQWFPSYDCNTNGIPDWCDIAEETSADCNTNGIPDECDIAAETSEDANTNGVPDECEEAGQQSMMQGGGGEGVQSSPYDNPAWEDFWQWQSDNAAELAAMSPWERFQATVEKLRDLGLPAAIPWARVQEAAP